MKHEDLNDDCSECDETEKEAIELLKSQQKQIMILKKSNTKLTEEIKSLKSKVKFFEDGHQDSEKFKAQYEALVEEKEHLRSQLYEKEKMTEELQREFYEISSKFKDLSERLLTQEDSSEKVSQLVELVKQYSRELTESTEKNKVYEKELKSLNSEMNNLMQKEQKRSIERNKLEAEVKEEISTANKDIGLLCQWIDSYLGVYFEPTVEIPDIPNFFNKRLNFTLLKEKIFESRKRIYEQQYKYEQNIVNLKNQQFDFLTKIEKLNKNLSSTQNENMNLKAQIDSMMMKIDDLNNRLNLEKIDSCNTTKNILSFLAKLNNRIIKLRPQDPKILEINENEKITDFIYDNFENNFNYLLDYCIDLETKNEITREREKNLITKDELNTVKDFYQSQIESLESEIRNFKTQRTYSSIS